MKFQDNSKKLPNTVTEIVSRPFNTSLVLRFKLHFVLKMPGSVGTKTDQKNIPGNDKLLLRTPRTKVNNLGVMTYQILKTIQRSLH